jgi:hypothetical protein
MINNQQYHRLMKEYEQTGKVSVSAMRADMSRPTARKYLRKQQAPDELQAKHDWRTRLDPLEPVWKEALGMLADAPELEAKALFEHLLKPFTCERSKGGYGSGGCSTVRTKR